MKIVEFIELAKVHPVNAADLAGHSRNHSDQCRGYAVAAFFSKNEIEYGKWIRMSLNSANKAKDPYCRIRDAVWPVYVMARKGNTTFDSIVGELMADLKNEPSFITQAYGFTHLLAAVFPSGPAAIESVARSLIDSAAQIKTKKRNWFLKHAALAIGEVLPDLARQTIDLIDRPQTRATTLTQLLAKEFCRPRKFIEDFIQVEDCKICISSANFTKY